MENNVFNPLKTLFQPVKNSQQAPNKMLGNKGLGRQLREQAAHQSSKRPRIDGPVTLDHLDRQLSQHADFGKDCLQPKPGGYAD